MHIDMTRRLYTGTSKKGQFAHLCFGTVKNVGSDEVYGLSICEDGSRFIYNLNDGIAIPTNTRLCWRCLTTLCRLLSEAVGESTYPQTSEIQKAAIAGMLTQMRARTALNSMIASGQLIKLKSLETAVAGA